MSVLIQTAETKLYKAVLMCNTYEQLYYTHVNTIFLDVGSEFKTELERQSCLIGWNQFVERIRYDIDIYKKANPQFNRISKGIVINILSKHSIYYKSQYREVDIVREVSYTSLLYIERLIGYFQWMEKTEYSGDDFLSRIVRFNNREKKHIIVENSKELNTTLNNIYTNYMSHFKDHSILDKDYILDVLYTIYKQYCPAPSVS